MNTATLAGGSWDWSKMSGTQLLWLLLGIAIVIGACSAISSIAHAYRYRNAVDEDDVRLRIVELEHERLLAEIHHRAEAGYYHVEAERMMDVDERDPFGENHDDDDEEDDGITVTLTNQEDTDALMRLIERERRLYAQLMPSIPGQPSTDA